MAVLLVCVCQMVNGFDSQGGFTALIFAADVGNAACLRLLIDAGADKEAKNKVFHQSLLFLLLLLVCSITTSFCICIILSFFNLFH